MAMGHRDAGRQQDLFVTTDQLPKSIGLLSLRRFLGIPLTYITSPTGTR